jgi:hypothetical protein
MVREPVSTCRFRVTSRGMTRPGGRARSAASRGDPGAGPSSFALGKGELLVIEIPESGGLKKRAPDVFGALLDCTSFVNARYVKSGGKPLIALLLA